MDVNVITSRSIFFLILSGETLSIFLNVIRKFAIYFDIDLVQKSEPISCQYHRNNLLSWGITPQTYVGCGSNLTSL